MIKLFITSACFGVFYSWTPTVADIYQTFAVAQPGPVSTHVTLLIIGSGISALAFWGRRHGIKV